MAIHKLFSKILLIQTYHSTCVSFSCEFISYLSVQQSNYHPLGAVDDSINCCPLPSASGNSSSGHPQHLGGDSFDCCTERYEIVVYCRNLMLLLLVTERDEHWSIVYWCSVVT